MATRHRCTTRPTRYCPNADPEGLGLPGKGPDTCRECGSEIYRTKVVYAVCMWRGDAGYSLADARRTFQTAGAGYRWIALQKQADPAYYATIPGGLVVRAVLVN